MSARETFSEADASCAMLQFCHLCVSFGRYPVGALTTTAREMAMQAPQELYQSKRASARDALNHLRDGDMIIVPTGVGEPPALLGALSDERRRFRGIKVAQIL